MSLNITSHRCSYVVSVSTNSRRYTTDRLSRGVHRKVWDVRDAGKEVIKQANRQGGAELGRSAVAWLVKIIEEL